MSAENFIAKLNENLPTAYEIHKELERLTTASVKKTLTSMFGRFDEDDVRGIVIDTFIVVYTNNSKGKSLDFSDPPKSLQSYFWKIAENLCKKYQRDKYKDKKLDSMADDDGEGNVKQFASASKNPEEILIDKEKNQIHQQCIKKILDELEKSEPDKYKALFSYMKTEGRTSREMKKHRENLAVSLSVIPANLTLRVNRINKKLRERLKKCLAAKGL